MKKLILTILALGLIWFIFVKEDQVVLGPGVMAPQQPQQSKLSSPGSFVFNRYRITPLAEFNLKAKVLSRKDYSSGREADLSPVDLALGWGRMSDEGVLAALQIRQSGRWYRWKTDNFPIPRREIETHSANMHMVPADSSVESALKKARKGDLIRLSGKLIRADADDGWRWISSLTRNDTGGGSCELIWVDYFEVLKPSLPAMESEARAGSPR